jgi:outer membrane lipoprotein-sorting protein
MSTFAITLPSRRVFLPRYGKATLLFGLLSCLCFLRAPLAADTKPGLTKPAPTNIKPAPTNVSAAQIVEKHVAARGGLQAWHALQTLSVTGKMDAGAGDSALRSDKVARLGVGASVKHAPPGGLAPADKAGPKQVQLPFTLEMKRPRKSRLELQFAGNTAVQVFDGTNGWKVRPFLNRNDVQPFTAEELKSEGDRADLEGPLVDYATKGTKVELAGVEPVDGHDAYKLKLTTKSGKVQHIWIDTHSFLDVKVQGVPRRFDGRMRDVWVYQRDFKSVGGLNIPHEYETAVDGVTQTHKTVFESVKVNASLDDARFTKPQPVASPAPAATPAPSAAPKLGALPTPAATDSK